MKTEEINLDHLAAKTAAGLFEAVFKQKCKKDAEVTAADADNLFTKALGVVQESGPFACTLYLLYRSGKEAKFADAAAEEFVACHTLSTLLSMAQEPGFATVQIPWKTGALAPERVTHDKKIVLDHMLEVSGVDLQRLLLIKQVWEQTLTYARYIARSRRGKKDSK